MTKMNALMTLKKMRTQLQKIQMRRKKKIIQMDVVVAAETIQVDAADLRD